MKDYWHKWEDERPKIGSTIVIVCDDGCSSSLALMTEDGPIDAEDADTYYHSYLNGAIWTELPDNYGLAFMERHDDY